MHPCWIKWLIYGCRWKEGEEPKEWLTGVLHYLAVRNPPSWRRRWDVRIGPAFQNEELKPHCTHTHTHTHTRQKAEGKRERIKWETLAQVFWRVKVDAFGYSEGQWESLNVQVHWGKYRSVSSQGRWDIKYLQAWGTEDISVKHFPSVC